MPMTEKQKAQWFVYHVSTDETRPRYADIQSQTGAMVLRIKELDCWNRCQPAEWLVGVAEPGTGVVEKRMQEVREWANSFCDAVDAVVPTCADASTAQRQARLSAMHVNWCLMQIHRGAQPAALSDRLSWADQALSEASLWANMAIATGGA